MGIVRVIGGRDKFEGEIVNTTSKSTNWSKGLSPFYLKDIELYGGYQAKNMENAWQFAKVYQHHVDSEGNPTADYFHWAKEGWNSQWAFRYPMGKGAVPIYSLWDGDKLNYIEARKNIYLPLYAKAVVKTKAYQTLKTLYLDKGEVSLWDFDGYDYLSLGKSLQDVLYDPKRKMGHAFVLAMLLQGMCEVSLDGVVLLHFAEQQVLF